MTGHLDSEVALQRPSESVARIDARLVFIVATLREQSPLVFYTCDVKTRIKECESWLFTVLSLASYHLVILQTAGNKSALILLAHTYSSSFIICIEFVEITVKPDAQLSLVEDILTYSHLNLGLKTLLLQCWNNKDLFLRTLGVIQWIWDPNQCLFPAFAELPAKVPMLSLRSLCLCYVNTL